MSKPISIEQFKKLVPTGMKRNVTPEFIEKLNNIADDPDTIETFKENILSYAGVMRDGRFKLSQYINAVKYVSYKLLGSTNVAAYVQTFPETYQRLLDKGTTDKTISAYVAGYNKTKLVNLIYEQSFIPTYVLNAHMFQEALNVQADLMLTARSEKVRSDAANSLLIHLKRPEVQKIELDIGVKEDKSIQELRASTLELVRQQRAMIKSGEVSALAIAESKLVTIEVEAEDATD